VTGGGSFITFPEEQKAGFLLTKLRSPLRIWVAQYFFSICPILDSNAFWAAYTYN
jgi:hypothetical protein